MRQQPFQAKNVYSLVNYKIKNACWLGEITGHMSCTRLKTKPSHFLKALATMSDKQCPMLSETTGKPQVKGNLHMSTTQSPLPRLPVQSLQSFLSLLRF